MRKASYHRLAYLSGNFALQFVELGNLLPGVVQLRCKRLHLHREVWTRLLVLCVLERSLCTVQLCLQVFDRIHRGGKGAKLSVDLGPLALYLGDVLLLCFPRLGAPGEVSLVLVDPVPDLARGFT